MLVSADGNNCDSKYTEKVKDVDDITNSLTFSKQYHKMNSKVKLCKENV